MLLHKQKTCMWTRCRIARGSIESEVHHSAWLPGITRIWRPSLVKKVKAELVGGSARTFFRYVRMYIPILVCIIYVCLKCTTLVAHSLFFADWAKANGLDTVYYVCIIYTAAAFAFARVPQSSRVGGNHNRIYLSSRARTIIV